ncbi:MAG TPA: hypothetical protein VN736_15820 [Candidatus Limnocylindrales bacterium]|nr:hypothetical protein [Candidatus Limnocylindrales bacterium]
MKRLVVIGVLAALPALADTQFRIRQMTRDDVPRGKGQCDIRLQVDNTAEVSVRGDSVFIHTLAGRDPRDDGSECNAPLPRDPRGMRFEVKDSRGEIRLVSEPTRGNGGTAVVFIRDSAGGEGRYHFRLSWEMEGAGYSEAVPPPPPAFRRNEVRFRGPGSGSMRVGQRETPLFDARVNVEPGGDAEIQFQTDRREPMFLRGVVEQADRDGLRLRASVDLPGGRRLGGRAFVTLDDRGVVRRIVMDGDDVHLRWESR